MWYDILVGVVLLIAAYRGSKKGFLWQLATIAGIVLCFFFATPVSLIISPYLGVQPPLSRWIAIFIVYVVASLVTYGMASSIRTWLEKNKFKEYDEHLGGIFGLLKGAIFCVILTFFCVTLSSTTRDSVMHSYSGYASAWFMEQINPVMPEEFKDLIYPYTHKLTPETIAKAKELKAQEQLSNGNTKEADNPLFPLNNSGNWSSNSVNITETESAIIDEAIKGLPNFFTQDLKDAVKNALMQVGASQRDELINKLQSASPLALQEFATQLLNTPKPKNNLEQTDPKIQQREELKRKIATIYFDIPSVQDAVIDEMNTVFQGLPVHAVDTILTDWYVDLTKSGQDPVPSTDGLTGLNKRVLTHLSMHRVAMQDLSPEVQSKVAEMARR